MIVRLLLDWYWIYSIFNSKSKCKM